jgi:hypothetical protein
VRNLEVGPSLKEDGGVDDHSEAPVTVVDLVGVRTP